MNLTDGATFLMTLFKRAKCRIKQKYIFCVTKIDAYKMVYYKMVETNRLSRYCVINAMVNFFT